MEKNIIIDITSNFQIKSSEIDKVLKVGIGDVINKDDILASKRIKFGFKKIELKSPISGTVMNIDRDKGSILIQSNNYDLPDHEIQVDKNNENNKKYTRPSKKNGVVANYGFGRGSGEGIYISNDQKFDISADYKGKVILIDSVLTVKSLYQSSTVGIEAVVCGDPQSIVNINDIQNTIKEMSGKVQLGFLYINGLSVAKFDKKNLYIDGEKKELFVK